MTRRVLLALAASSVAVAANSCGKGVGPSGPSAVPTVSPVANTRAVAFMAFLDENGNRSLDPGELTRIPNIEIAAGLTRGRTAALTGQATIQVPDGAQTVEVTAASLPPFFRPPAPIAITVPVASTVMVPITLPLDSNRPMLYMGFGDSITNGEPEVGDGNGYRLILETMLRAHFGTGTVANEGVDSTRSNRGADRIGDSLSRVRPAFTLIHYGTNDWNDSACNDLPCYTTDAMRSMVRQINQSGGHAFLATILPVNVGYDDRAPASRNEWVAQQNVYIRQVADAEGAVLVDLNGAFFRSGLSNRALFVDHVHPTAAGYQIMAQTWFDAITKAYSRILSES